MNAESHYTTESRTNPIISLAKVVTRIFLCYILNRQGPIFEYLMVIASTNWTVISSSGICEIETNIISKQSKFRHTLRIMYITLTYILLMYITSTYIFPESVL